MTKNILLVEDCAITAVAGKLNLEKEGYAVSHVGSGEMAIEFIHERSNTIDLILMDIDLGVGIDGIQTAQEILMNHDIPIVFLSSHSEKHIIETTEKITSYGYVVKSSDKTTLFSTIKMALKLHEAFKDAHQNEKKYLKTNQVLENFLSGVEVAVLAIDTHSRKITKCNHAVSNMFGYTPQEIIGNKASLVHVDHDEQEKHEEEVRNSFKKEGYYCSKYKMRRKNGEVFPTSNYLKPIFDENEKVKYVVSVVRDISNYEQIKNDYLEEIETKVQVIKELKKI